MRCTLRPGRSVVFPSLVVLALTCATFAPARAHAAEKAVPIRETTIYITPEKSAARLGTIPRGRETNILETSPGWLHVFVTNDQNKDVSGWVEDKGVLRMTTPNADKILFGEAVDSEAEAQKRHGRKGADVDAGRLYMRIFDLFPTSPLAGEALYRAADIRWQIDTADVQSRPSSRERDPNSRVLLEEDLMRQVKKKYPGTKWADMADFALIDNKLCGEWKAESKCPEREAELYTKYADEHPKSPKLAEALYDAAYRQAALVDIYKTEGDAAKSAGAKSRATTLAQRVISSAPDSDYAARAQRLSYIVQQGLTVYGSPSD
jgi:hypothetical protein